MALGSPALALTDLDMIREIHAHYIPGRQCMPPLCPAFSKPFLGRLLSARVHKMFGRYLKAEQDLQAALPHAPAAMQPKIHVLIRESQVGCIIPA